jgi:hypothetical protein
LKWVGDAWRRAVGHILTWVSHAWRDVGVAERNMLVTDGTKLAAEERIGANVSRADFAISATRDHYWGDAVPGWSHECGTCWAKMRLIDVEFLQLSAFRLFPFASGPVIMIRGEEWISRGSMFPRPVHFAWLFVSFAFVITEVRADTEPKVEVEARGPLHEAFAQPWQKDAAANQPIDQKPPDPIAEEPPDEKPAGENVQWIPGYWQWDDDRRDFIWISGFWRDIPSGRRWIAGYWSQGTEGWRWVNGHWAAEPEQDYQYVPQPPDNLDVGPSIPAPDDESFYIPGSWFYSTSGYRWRPGYWANYRPGFMWNPARYIWSPQGYYFTSGYWDFAFGARGLLYAPVYFTSRPWINPGWAFRPTFSISVGLAFNSFFFRAGFGHYYFGDFYGSRYAGFGYQPWVNFGARQYDPIFAYERWNNRNNAQWLTSMRQTNDGRMNGTLPLPPRTLADQTRLAGNARTPAMITSADQLRKSGQRFEQVSAQQRTTQLQSTKQIVARSQEQSRSSARLTTPVPDRTQPRGASSNQFRQAGSSPANGRSVTQSGGQLPANPNPPVPPRTGAATGSKPNVTIPSTTNPTPPATPRAVSGTNSRPNVTYPAPSTPSTPRTIISGSSGNSNSGRITNPNIGGSRPSTPNVGGSGSRPSMPSIGGGSGSRPSMPSIGGGSGSRPSMPSIGGGGSRPSGGGLPSGGGGGRPGGKR